jgi:signal transduction histidine kinase
MELGESAAAMSMEPALESSMSEGALSEGAAEEAAHGAHLPPTQSGGEVRVAIHSSGRNAEVIIRDNGRGIPEDLLAKLFDQNFSTEGPRVKLRVGLPANRRAVEELGGNLRIDSALGTGTEAIVRLPRADVPAVKTA